MDDRESKWKIQEYTSSKEDDDEDDDDDDEAKASVVRRILTNGYVIGREVVITGIFISSAPLVVPPLVVVSVVGFAFTAPFGVLCASYACTNKLMSMLLPSTPPLMLQEYYYYTDDELDKEDDGYDNYRELDYKEDDNYGVEVEGYVSDIEDNELVEGVNQEVGTEIVFDSAGDYREEGDTLIANVGEDVDELETEVEYDMLQRENDTEMEDVMEGVEMRPGFDVAPDDQGYEEDAGEYVEVDDDIVEEEQKREEALVENWDDENESAPEVNGDAKFIRDEGRVDNWVEDDHAVDDSASNVVFGDVTDVGTPETVTSESASDVVFGDVKNVGTPEPVTSEGDSNVVFGDLTDVRTTIQATSESASNVIFGDVETTKPIRSESASNEVFEDVKNVGTTEPVTSESASNVVFGDGKDAETTISITIGSVPNVVLGDVKDVATTESVTSVGASDVVIGDVTDVGTTELVTSEIASNVVFGDVKNVETAKPITTSIGASDAVSGEVRDVETSKPVTSLDASNVVFRDDKDLETTKPVTSEITDRKSGLDDAGGAYRQLEGDDDIVEEERKREELLVESLFDEIQSNSHEVNEDVKSGDEVEDDVVYESASDVVFGDDKDVEATKPVTVIEIESEKLVEKGTENEVPVGEMRHVVILSCGSDQNDYNARVVDELDLVARAVIGDGDKVERNKKADEEVVRGATTADASMDGTEDAILRSMEEHLIHSKADAQKNGEKNVLDERNTNNNLEACNEVKENVVDDNVDVMAFSPSKCDIDNGNEVKDNAGAGNVKHDTGNGSEVKENGADDNVDVLTTKCNTDDAKVVYKKMPSREENMDDEKIWEKITAMRTIVGYKAPSQPTCVGELKALYVFTGVEPPASFEGDSDLDAKLKFLMAIVGVK